MRAWWLVGIGIVAACSDETPKDYEILSGGSGIANTEPLDPYRDGTVRGGFIVDGTVDLPTGRARRALDTSTGEYFYYIDREDGTFVAGGLFDGVLADPVLIVPATVRVGMKWKTTASYTFEVTDRVEGDGSFGHIIEWTIARTNPDGTTGERKYAEGIGNTNSVGGIMVLPLDSPDPEPSAAPRVSLETMPGTTDDMPEPVSARSISMVRAPGHDALLMYDDLRSDGISAHCIKIGAAGATIAASVGGAPYRRSGPEECPAMNVSGGPSGSLLISGHASGAYVEASGDIDWIPRDQGTFTTSGLYDVTSLHDTLAARALIAGTTHPVDMVYATTAGTSYANVGGWAYLDGTFSQTEDDVQIPDPYFALGTSIMFISPLTTDDGDRNVLLIQTADSMLWLAHVSTTAMTTPVQVGRLGGTLSVQATERGGEILRVTSDGQVDRLHASGSELTLEPLANLEIPTSLVVDTAFLFRDPAGDRLVVTALDVSTPEDGASEKIFRSTQSITTSTVRVRLTPAAMVADAGGFLDQLVCLPPGDEGVELGGWTLGGKPATAIEVTPGRRCVLVVRGPGQSTAEPALFTMRGSFPGLGRVVVVNSIEASSFTGRAPDVAFLLAPLAGGGAVHPNRRLGRGLVWTEPLVTTPRQHGVESYGPLLDAAGDFSVVDAHGEGLWGVRSAYTPATTPDGMDVVRFGATPFHKAYYGVIIACPSQKAGVVAMIQRGPGMFSEWVRLTSDGVEVSLPPPPAGDSSYCAELADGTLCGDHFDGVSKMQYFCTSPGGSPRFLDAVVDELSGSQIRCAGTIPLPDGSLTLVGTNTSHVYRLDPTTMTTSLYMDVTLPFLRAQGTDGSAWGASIAADGGITLSHLQPSGPEVVTSGEYFTLPTPNLQLVVDDSVIGIASDGTLVRIPHP